jgi:hypothetical protein
VTAKHLSDALRAGAADAYARWWRFGHAALYRNLRARSALQIKTFESEAAAFPDLLLQLSKPIDERFVAPTWREANREVSGALAQAPPVSFLQNRTIRTTMVFSRPGRAHQIEAHAVLGSDLYKRQPDIVNEDYAGVPPLIALGERISSTNLIHHLFHLTRLEALVDSVANYERIVEWGGGYGDLAKLVCRLSPACTYAIVDTPLFSALQTVYLRTTLGPKRVNVITEENRALRSGAVNIVALPFLECLDTPFELFLATWSLSESPKLAHDYVFARDFFGARTKFLGCQVSSHLFPDADAFGARLHAAGYRTEPIAFLPGNVYAWSA